MSNVTGIENIPIGVENYTTTKVTNIKSMILPSSVKKIKSQAFYNWTGLTSITLPDSVEELESSIFMLESGGNRHLESGRINQF